MLSARQSSATPSDTAEASLARTRGGYPRIRKAPTRSPLAGQAARSRSVRANRRLCVCRGSSRQHLIWKRKGGQACSVENLGEVKEDHDVVGENAEHGLSALGPVRPSAERRTQVSLEHAEGRLDLPALAVRLSVERLRYLAPMRTRHRLRRIGEVPPNVVTTLAEGGPWRYHQDRSRLIGAQLGLGSRAPNGSVTSPLILPPTSLKKPPISPRNHIVRSSYASLSKSRSSLCDRGSPRTCPRQLANPVDQCISPNSQMVGADEPSIPP